jgi:hypothetical protein
MPTFEWHPVVGATTYRVQVANNDRFHKPISMDLTDTVFTVSSSLVDTRWYWRVSTDLNHNLYSDVDSLVVYAQVGAGTPHSRRLSGVRIRITASAALLELGDAGPYRVTVLDARGRQVAAALVNRGSHALALPRGVAAVSVAGPSGTVVTRVCGVR